MGGRVDDTSGAHAVACDVAGAGVVGSRTGHAVTGDVCGCFHLDRSTIGMIHISRERQIDYATSADNDDILVAWLGAHGL
jgi:hypothetical protein